MNRIEQFVVMVVIGAMAWTIVLLPWSFPPSFFYPPQEEHVETPFGTYDKVPRIGEYAGWVLFFIGFCLILGLPIFLGLKQLHKRSERFKKIVNKVR